MLPIHTLVLCVAMAGAGGLRAFLPLFYLAVALHTGLYPAGVVNPHLLDTIDLAHSGGVLLVLGLLTAAEIGIEKVVTLAEWLDVPFLLCRLASAACLAFALVDIPDLGTAITAALVTAALGIIPVMNLLVRENAADVMHLPGYVNFYSSLLLDAICFLVAAVALQAPFLALAILYVATWVSNLMMGSWKAKLRHEAALRSLPEAPQLPENWVGVEKHRSER